MIDLLFSSSGDIFLTETNTRKESIRVSFSVTSSSSSVNISFLTSKGSAPDVGTNGIKVSFNCIKSESGYQALTIDNKSATSQKVMVYLKTELGDIAKRKNLGSRLYKHRHKALFDRNNINDVETSVKEVISHIIPNARVVVTPIVRKELSYEQCMHINIKSNMMNEVNYVF